MLLFSKQEQRFVLLLLFAFLTGFGIHYYKKVQHTKPANEWLTYHQILIKEFKQVSVNSSTTINSNHGNRIHGTLSKKSFVGKININTATMSEIEMLPGIGPVKAKRIIDFREQSGLFEKIEDIKKVKGIGPKTFERIKETIKVE